MPKNRKKINELVKCVINKYMSEFLPAVTGFAIFTFIARSLSVCEKNIHLNQLLQFKWEQCTLGNKENTLDGSKQHDTQYSYELQHCEMRLQPLEQEKIDSESYLFQGRWSNQYQSQRKTHWQENWSPFTGQHLVHESTERAVHT